MVFFFWYNLDNGETYDRLLTTPIRVIELLNWGEVGRLQVEEALRLAKEVLKLNDFNDKEEYVWYIFFLYDILVMEGVLLWKIYLKLMKL